MAYPTPSKTGIQSYGNVPDGTAQPDWNITDDGRGLLIGTLKFYYNQKTGKTLEVTPPKRGDRHPFDERLVCKDVQTTVSQNNICYVDANYVGLTQDPSGVEWTLNCPTEEAPISVHPKFILTSDKQGSWGHLESIDKDTGIPSWNANMVKYVFDMSRTFESFIVSNETLAKDLVGVESYKVSRPTLNITLHTANKDLLYTAIKNVGKQYIKPPFGPDWADTSRDNRTWLFTSLSVTEYAGIYKLETEYMLSGIGSDNKGKTWNKLIYPFA